MNLQANLRANPRPDPPGAAEPGGDLATMIDGWALSGHGALPRRLAHALRRVISAGVLADGSKLPPERRLAEQLAVSRATVTQALDELRGEGLIESRRGSGTVVVGLAAPSPVGTRVAEHLVGGPGVDLATAQPPDLSHLPAVQVDMALLNAAHGGPGVDVSGLPALREALAARYSDGSFTGRPHVTGPEQVHITAGAHQAIALLLAALVGRRRAVAFSEINYPGLFDIIDGIEARPAPVRGDSAGMLPEALAEVIAEQRPAVVYLQRGPHNPTGKVSGRARLSAIAEVLDDAGVTVIEDDTLAPLVFDGEPPSLVHLCRRATVVSIGSASKTCWGGLRLGWIRATGPLIEQTMLRHLASDLGASVPSQVLVSALLPHLDEIIGERRARLRAAVDLAGERLHETIPEATFEPPDGGSSLWVHFPIEDSAVLARHARRFGVRVAPGSIHVTKRHPQPYLRICVDRAHDHIVEGLTRLSHAWRDLGT